MRSSRRWRALSGSACGARPDSGGSLIEPRSRAPAHHARLLALPLRVAPFRNTVWQHCEEAALFSAKHALSQCASARGFLPLFIVALLAPGLHRRRIVLSAQHDDGTLECHDAAKRDARRHRGAACSATGRGCPHRGGWTRGGTARRAARAPRHLHALLRGARPRASRGWGGGCGAGRWPLRTRSGCVSQALARIAAAWLSGM
jgi:hypothetical protein